MRPRLVGMLIPDGTNQFFSSLAQLYQRELGQREWPVVVMDSDGNSAREQSNIQTLIGMGVDAIIFISVGDSAAAFDQLRQANLPLLILDREVPLIANADFVIVDNGAGAQLAAQHLVALGHKRIACIQGLMATEPGRARWQGFQAYCQERRIELLPFPGKFVVGSGTVAADGILSLSSSSRPTAVFACNDLMAIGSIQRFEESGLHVPEDISIAGFDDIALASWIYPRLTTVRQDTLEIARVGAEHLIRRLDSLELDPRSIPDNRVAVIQPRLVERSSTGPAPPV